MPTIIFSHGKESGPNGKKIQKLAEVAKQHGYQIKSIDYRGMDDVNDRVALLEKEINLLAEKQLILVGSSMGGYVSAVASIKHPLAGLFLLCPALYMENYEVDTYPVKTNHIMVVHGWQDDIISYDNTIKFAKENQAKVLLVNDNHRLSDSHNILCNQFDLFLSSILY